MISFIITLLLFKRNDLLNKLSSPQSSYIILLVLSQMLHYDRLTKYIAALLLRIFLLSILLLLLLWLLKFATYKKISSPAIVDKIGGKEASLQSISIEQLCTDSTEKLSCVSNKFLSFSRGTTSDIIWCY